MYYRDTMRASENLKIPEHYSGCAFQNQPEPEQDENESEQVQTPTDFQSQNLFGFPKLNLPKSDEFLLLGLIFLLSDSEKSGEILPILSVLLFARS